MTTLTNIFTSAGHAAGRVGNAIVLTVQPAANLIEMASESTTLWTEQHSKQLAAKAERQDAVREQDNKSKLREALASAQRRTNKTADYVLQVQAETDLSNYKVRIQQFRKEAMEAASDEILKELSNKPNLTDADILKALQVGSMANVESDSEPAFNDFDINQFK